MEREAIDEVAKQWWEEYLKGTGLTEQLFKVALKDIMGAIASEERETPEKIQSIYTAIKEKYKMKNLAAIRSIRMAFLRDRLLRREDIASVAYNAEDKIDKHFFGAADKLCMHKCSGIVVVHFKEPSGCMKSMEFLKSNNVKFHAMIPQEWYTSKKKPVRV